MVVRTQIALAPEDHRRAKQRAAELGVSLAEYIRRVVAKDLGGVAQTGEISTIFDLGSSGGSDVSEHKHQYIGEAIEGQWRSEVEGA